MLRRPILLGLSVGLLAAALLAGSASAGGKRFALELDSATEVPPTPAGVTASGTGTLTLNAGTGELCFFFSLTGTNVGTITAAHIHEAPVGQAAPPLIPLALNGCLTSTDRENLVRVLADPDDFYVNVHSTTAPAGVGRDQLSHSHRH